MATKIFLPRLGESITEAIIGKWLKQPGDSVLRGEVIAELETAKAMMELESPAKGTLLAVFPKPGDIVHLEELIAVVGSPGEEWDTSEKTQAEKSDAKPTKLKQRKENQFNIKQENVPRLMISPNAKRRAKELGISQEQIGQISKEGRITALDIESLILGNDVPNPEYIPFVRIPLNQIQTITARRMQQSMQTIPQFSVSIDVITEGLSRFISKLKEAKKPKMTITAILIWKVAEALLKHPRMNSRFDKDSVLQYNDINIAVAVAAKDGLFVPVIHQANKLSVDEIAIKLNELATRAKNRRLDMIDTRGATFTISNLGMTGISSFIPLVDPDQSAILGIGSLHEGFSWDDNSNMHRMQVITLTLSADHRVVGGVEASDFLATIKQLIELL
jgi:pyruvate dehydrogenase E2 component (dihydrolipoamide acetyltransferase)